MQHSGNIILIGDGAIGSSFAFNCLTTGVGQSLGIIDVNEKRVQGDVEDLSDALHIRLKRISTQRVTKTANTPISL